MCSAPRNRSAPPPGTPNRTLLPEMIGGDAKIQDRSVVGDHPAIRSGGTGHDHDRQQMLFPWLRHARGGRLGPMPKLLVAFCLRQSSCLAQPAIERFRERCRLWREGAEIVERHPAADDEYSLIT